MWCVGFAACHTYPAQAAKRHMGGIVLGYLCLAGNINFRKLAGTLILDRLSTIVSAEIVWHNEVILNTTWTAEKLFVFSRRYFTR